MRIPGQKLTHPHSPPFDLRHGMNRLSQLPACVRLRLAMLAADLACRAESALLASTRDAHTCHDLLSSLALCKCLLQRWRCLFYYYLSLACQPDASVGAVARSTSGDRLPTSSHSLLPSPPAAQSSSHSRFLLHSLLVSLPCDSMCESAHTDRRQTQRDVHLFRKELRSKGARGERETTARNAENKQPDMF